MKYLIWSSARDEINIIVNHAGSTLKIHEGIPENNSTQGIPYMQFIYAQHFVRVWLDFKLKPMESHLINRKVLTYVKNKQI